MELIGVYFLWNTVNKIQLFSFMQDFTLLSIKKTITKKQITQRYEQRVLMLYGFYLRKQSK